MNRTKEFKMAVIEQVYLDRNLKGGFDVQKLNRETVDAMLDVIGGLLFDDEWTMNMPVKEES